MAWVRTSRWCRGVCPLSTTAKRSCYLYRAIALLARQTLFNLFAADQEFRLIKNGKVCMSVHPEPRTNLVTSRRLLHEMSPWIGCRMSPLGLAVDWPWHESPRNPSPQCLGRRC